MERLVTTYRIGIHEVDVLETLDDEGSWFHLVVDGLARTEILDRPPTENEAGRLLLGKRPA